MRINLVLASILVLLIISFIMLKTTPENYFKTTCETNLQYTDVTPDNEFNFSGRVPFDFEKDKKGQLYASGDLKIDGQTFRFSRQFMFTYTNEKPGKYTLSVQKIQTMAHDKTPDEIAEKFYRYTGLNKHSSIYLEKDSNYLLIGSMLSPILSCVIRG